MKKGPPRKKPDISNSPIVGGLEGLLLTFEFLVSSVTISAICAILFQTIPARAIPFFFQIPFTLLSWSLNSILIIVWMGWRNRNIFLTVRPPLKPFFGLNKFQIPYPTFFYVILLLGKVLQLQKNYFANYLQKKKDLSF